MSQHAEDSAALEAWRRMPADVERAVAGLSESELDLRDGADTLSIREIVHHLVESNLVACNDDRASRIGSVGKPVDGMEVMIHQPDQNGIGEIWVQGRSVLQKYYRSSEPAVDPQGWYHTGDWGYLDYDGFLFVLGRNHEVIVTATA